MKDASGFDEVAERCFVVRFPEWDVNVTAVVAEAGTLVVDTRATARQGRELRDAVRRLAPAAPVRWVVNSHVHFDHTFGNVAFESVPIHAHEAAAASLEASAERIKAMVRADPELDPDYPAITAEVLQDVLDTPLRVPDVTFSSVATIDLGDRYVELAHPGRGHTDGDIVVRVPDADVLVAGDLVEESGPPSYGVDCFPLEWAGSLDLVVGMLTASTVVVPGHGRAVDKAFVEEQRGDVSAVEQLIRSLAGSGVPVDQAVSEGERVGAWPFPAKRLGEAVRRGYAHLP